MLMGKNIDVPSPSDLNLNQKSFTNWPSTSHNSPLPNLSSTALSNKLIMSSQITNNVSKRNNVKRITNGKHKRNASSGPSKRPAFILKLWTMVNDPLNEPYIQWTPDGESFKVLSKENFEKVVLPKYFKHSNYSSFVRQLNMYGWHKVQDITSGAMQSGDEIRQFKSPYFIRGKEDLLDNIVRNKSSKGSDDEDEGDVGRILDELDVIKTSQMEIASDLNRIRSDNQMLWRECYESRERHKKHAETFERIMRFLATFYNQSKFVSDGATPSQKHQRLLLPNLNLSELSNGQISEIAPFSPSTMPFSAIEELMTNNSNSTDSFRTPSKSSRISTVSIDDQAKGVSHISDIETPQSTDNSPVSYTVESPEDIKLNQMGPNYKTSRKPSVSRTPKYDPLISSNSEPNIYTSPNPSVTTNDPQSRKPSNSNISIDSKYANTTASPASLQKVTSSALTQHQSIDFPLLNSPSLSGLNLPDNLDNIMNTNDDVPAITPLVSDALFTVHQDLASDNNTAQHLLGSTKDLDSIIQNISTQGDSLQRIQERIQRLTPYKAHVDTNVNFGSPSTDANFDVDEFLMNTSTDLLDVDDPFVDVGPPAKKTRLVKEEQVDA